MSEILCCPVCREKLKTAASGLVCPRGHSFDRAKEGYVNLLLGSKPGDRHGDSREMAASRRAFLDGDHYLLLAKKVGQILGENVAGGNILDICAGEGYYTEKLCELCPGLNFWGFDISREMVRLAARRKSRASFFVANLAGIPVESGSMAGAVHLFAPFNAPEFERILAPGGVLISVIPGKNHLMGLKKVLYDRPYENDEGEPDTGRLEIIDRIRVSFEMELSSREDIFALFQMTPYYFKTGVKGAKKLESLDNLKTQAEFVILLMRKRGS